MAVSQILWDWSLRNYVGERRSLLRSHLRILSQKRQKAMDSDMGLETHVQEQALQLVLQAGKQRASGPADEDRRRGLLGMSLSRSIN